MKIGILGGTFNPIHYGHLISANEILNQFLLDKVIFIPAARPPHKKTEGLLDAHHRWVMAVLATLSHSRLEVSDIEIRRRDKSYSVNTIEDLRQSFPPDTEFFFIAGCDAFREISTWKEVDQLLRSCNFIVTTRPGCMVEDLVGMLNETVVPLYQDISFREAGRDPHIQCSRILMASSSFFIYVVDILAVSISSSEVRRRIAQGKTVRYLVPSSVEEYMNKYELYREGRKS